VKKSSPTERRTNTYSGARGAAKLFQYEKKEGLNSISSEDRPFTVVNRLSKFSPRHRPDLTHTNQHTSRSIRSTYRMISLRWKRGNLFRKLHLSLSPKYNRGNQKHFARHRCCFRSLYRYFHSPGESEYYTLARREQRRTLKESRPLGCHRGSTSSEWCSEQGNIASTDRQSRAWCFLHHLIRKIARDRAMKSSHSLLFDLGPVPRSLCHSQPLAF